MQFIKWNNLPSYIIFDNAFEAMRGCTSSDGGVFKIVAVLAFTTMSPTLNLFSNILSSCPSLYSSLTIPDRMMHVRTTPSKYIELKPTHNYHHRLVSMLAYKFMTPEIQLRRGLTYMGSNRRLRKAVNKLLTDVLPVLRIGAIGGSITAGSYVKRHDIWFSVFQDWLVRIVVVKHLYQLALNKVMYVFYVVSVFRKFQYDLVAEETSQCPYRSITMDLHMPPRIMYVLILCGQLQCE